jgi:hypothetical protein
MVGLPETGDVEGAPWMTAAEELFAFAKGREEWQQDVIRRIYTQSDFGKNDPEDSVLILKAHHSPLDNVVVQRVLRGLFAMTRPAQ